MPNGCVHYQFSCALKLARKYDMKLNVDRDLVKQLVSGQLPNKSRHLEELTHEPSIWQCDTGQWLSCFDSCQLTILWMATVKDVDLPRHAWDTPPFLLIVSPTRTICRTRTLRTLGQPRDNQTKRGWPYSMSMELCPTRALLLSYYHKEFHRDIQLSRSQTSANSKRGSNTGHNTLWDKVKLIYRDPQCCCL